MIIFRKRVPGLTEATLARFVGRACRAVKMKGPVNVLVTGSRELRNLNRSFRGLDKPTDVLSFPPMLSFDNLAGDVAISAEIATRNARELGHSPADEVKILALHGVLHLAGYDHERDNGQMARKEERLRRTMGLPAALIQRTSGEKTLAADASRPRRQVRARLSARTRLGKARHKR